MAKRIAFVAQTIAVFDYVNDKHISEVYTRVSERMYDIL
jgi:hypothetical protein